MVDVKDIVKRFGGLSEMQRALGHSHASRVQGWRDRNCIPSRQIGAVLKAARERGIPLEVTELVEAA
mgnify:CR=1 FL=1